jgi:hypothetical protein
VKTLAALTSIPGRPLEQVLRALRPQVDALHVLLDPAYRRIPRYCEDLCDEVALDEARLGSGGKFFWAQSWRGLYLCCDDDILYPKRYVVRMRSEVERWGGRAIVSCWGRIYPPHPLNFLDWQGTGSYRAATPGAWVNHLGTGTLAFPTTLNVPARWPTHNDEEIDFNVWAQRQGRPLWCIEHPADWPPRLPLDPNAPTVFKAAKASGYAARNAGLASVEWRVHRPPECPELGSAGPGAADPPTGR